MGNHEWPYKEKLMAVAVDEAHLVKEWLELMLQYCLVYLCVV